MKKLIALLLAAALLAGVAGVLSACGGGASEETDAPTLALVVAGKFGDRSFYDSSKEGADRLAADLGVEVSTIECNNENHNTQMKNAADKADIVVCVGWEFYEIAEIAPTYPDVKWIWIDNATESPVSNVLNITYAQNEGSFLAGYIAAAMSESGVVGRRRRRGQRHHQRFYRGLRAGRQILWPGKGQGCPGGQKLRRYL